MDVDTTEDERMLSGLCYPLWMLLAPFLFFSPRPFLKFHAIQSAAAGLGAAILYGLLWGVFVAGSGANPSSPGLMYGVIMMAWFGGLLLIGVVVFSLFMYWAWKAWQGLVFHLPVLGGWAQRLAGLEPPV